LDGIGGEAVAILQGCGQVRGFRAFRQSNEFYYLCGVEVPHAYLLLDGSTCRTTLYLPGPDDSRARNEGGDLTAESHEAIQRLTGVDALRAPEALSEDVAGARVIFAPHSPAEGAMASRDVVQAADRGVAQDPWDGRPTRQARLLSLLSACNPEAEVRDLCPLLDHLRAIKSPREVGLLRQAARLAGLAVMEAMRSTQPGVVEYQLAAVANCIFLANGARGEGYRSIVAGGPNAWYGHYWRNDCELEDGDLVLMDCAPDYRYYTSDIGRMWPVNGTYSPQQRELYGFVVEYHKALLPRIRPGVMAAQIMEEAAGEMARVVAGWSFSKRVYEEAARRMLEFTGHLSHPVGMAVHDVGGYHSRPLAPGVVFAVDPQMWVPEEKLYIRVEDTVVVTDTGSEVLTGVAPLDLGAVEALMQEEGLLQRMLPGLAA